jgi:glycosyltransferase involved in cell wall biosynthesis
MKYAAREGWQFIVLTEDIDRPVIIQEQKSGFLLDEVPPDTEVIRVANPLFGGEGIKGIAKAIFKDSSLPWGLNVVRTCIRQVKKESIDLIFANAPPYTNPFIGSILKYLYSCPYVFDMKDDWVGKPSFEAKNKIRQVIESILEGAIIRSTQYTVLVTQASMDKYQARYQKRREVEKFHLISNGCDLEEYEILMERKRQITSKKFTMLGVGSGYRVGHRDPTALLYGIKKFIDKYPDSKRRILVDFLGDEPSIEYKDLVDHLGLGDVVRYSKPVERRELIERLWDADLLFDALVPDIPTAISGTLYEYWATGKAPILLVSEEGAGSKIVDENKLGMHALFDEADKIADFIEKVYLAYQAGSPVWITREGVEKFSRKELTAQMVRLWNQAVGV